jgi:hypothetical protein
MWFALRVVLVVAAIVVAIPVVPIAAWIAYWAIVPVHSASTVIADLRTALTLRFYHTWDADNDDHGVYLHVTGPTGHLRIAMKIFDWAHDSRTSLYLTPRWEIGVLGPMGDDYLISLDPLDSRDRWVRGPTDDWTYLGAFDYDYRSPARNGNRLRFFSAAEQVECIPMLGGHIGDYLPRMAARQNHCRFYMDPRLP